MTFYIGENGVQRSTPDPEFDPEPERHSPARLQVPACDKCSVGVMDATNPHLLGSCRCGCHHKGSVWQDPAGFYVAACDCGWRDTTWTSIRSASQRLRRHREETSQ